MKRDFEIVDGIYLVQSKYELDLHNNFDFLGLTYSVENRTLLLNWHRSDGEWVASGTPESVKVEFREVSEFRFMPEMQSFRSQKTIVLIHLGIGFMKIGQKV